MMKEYKLLRNGTLITIFYAGSDSRAFVRARQDLLAQIAAGHLAPGEYELWRIAPTPSQLLGTIAIPAELPTLAIRRRPDPACTGPAYHKQER